MYYLNFFLVFICVLLADVCWAMYFNKIAKEKSFQAAIWGSFVYLCGAITISSYINDKTLIIAAVLGGFIGTYLTVEYNKRKKG